VRITHARTLIVLLVMIVVLPLLAACGGNASGEGTTSTASSSTASQTTQTQSPAASDSPATSTNWKPRNLRANLTGSGSTFVDPAMQLWIEQYKKLAPGVAINYQAVGSGQGIKDFTGDITAFAGSDAYMTDEQMRQAPDAIHLPVVVGAVTVFYNLPGITNLRFSGTTIADIFLGKVTKWNDPEIAHDNPGVKLPGTAITPVHRSDGSGTTAIFTDYLSKVSSAWKSKVGEGTSVSWPTGIGGEKSPGVTSAVQQTPGAIGYVELIYALQNKLPTPAVENAAGKFVVPSLQTSSSAAAAYLGSLPPDLRIFITDPKTGNDAYPITGFSWLILRSQMKNKTDAEALSDFVYWIITQGQRYSQQLQYAPIPSSIQQLEIKALERITVDGQPVFSAPSPAS